MTETATSKNGAAIRLTDERWSHITEEHAELAGYRLELLEAIEEPEKILAGSAGESLALKKQKDGKTLVVVYREAAGDGFVITAFFTRREASVKRRKQLWP
ncbi:MAG: PBECR2 nuclease fold domain-containing protein [Limisphaerales bacterium]